MTSTTPTSRAVRRPRVLIVEDERRLRELLLDVVPAMGFEARAARSAEDAAELLRAEPAEILLLDLHLPGASGLDLLGRVRASLPDVQAVILTAYGDLDTARHAIRADVADFLTKPAPLGEIEAALERARKRWAGRAVGTPPSAEATPAPTGTTLDDMEREQIRAALSRHAGSRTAAALELGISRRTLHYKLNRYRREGHEIE